MKKRLSTNSISTLFFVVAVLTLFTAIGVVLGVVIPRTYLSSNFRLPTFFKKERLDSKVAIPQTIYIPQIGVEAKVESVGLDQNRKMEVPKDTNNVGWYRFGPRPGQKGNSVITGHLDSETGPAVFFDLSNIKEGDQIIVTDSNKMQYQFKVTQKEIYENKKFPFKEVFGPSDEARLNLITCGGDFDNLKKEYTHRIVVYSEMIG